MTKITTIKENRSFMNAYRRGKKVETKYFVIYYRKNRFNVTRLGITTGKKLGNAVTRNRIRRVLREAYRNVQDSLICGYDIVIVARISMATKKEYEIERVLRENLPKELIKE